MNLFKNLFVNNKNLDSILTSVSNNAENNYKDAAQQNFKTFLSEFDKLKNNGTLSARQIEYYNRIKIRYEELLKDFHH